MTVVEIGVAAVAAMVADLRGNESTRPFTRHAFWGLVLLDAGVSAAGLASWMGDVTMSLGGLI